MPAPHAYHIAQTARCKLAQAASQPDHDLRLLVGHANMLDALMLNLARSTSNGSRGRSVSYGPTARTPPQSPNRHRAADARDQHIRWADMVATDEDNEEAIVSDSDLDSDVDSDESDSEEDYEDERDDADTVPSFPTAFKVPQLRVTTRELANEEDDADDYDDYDDYDDDGQDLTLTRVPSHSQPPELLHDPEDYSSEEDSPPPSPPHSALAQFVASADGVEIDAKDLRLHPQSSLLQHDGLFPPSQSETPLVLN